ncbi:hypothetical protein [Hymenobacter glacialis]|uniref:Uncharacterized protein n=1 Tax=Hymenobacter glacialis TaxID=1908236 RepID=A0A1G1TCM5_9BACT|nr:hypothetical protein [Hymenobacter glacialis]OGX88591.1 hypothetical protein BEN48_09455 [Hymenobacter glacialis]
MSTITNYEAMFFADTKTGHLLHILGTALAGQVLTQELAPANPHIIEMYGHLVIQVIVAAVTIWATIRKAMQRPEAVVKLSAAGLGSGVGDSTGAAASSPAEPAAEVGKG